MSKAITNITTSQTFQAWFEKTNEMVDIFASDAVTASASGDTTTGSATLTGNFTADTLIGNVSTDQISAATPGQTITSSAPISITNGSGATCATFNYGSGGGRTSYTNGSLTWETGLESNSPGNFIIDTGSGTRKFLLSTTGALTVPYLTTTDTITCGTDMDVSGTLTVDGLATFSGGIDGLDTTGVTEDPSGTYSSGTLYFTRARAGEALSSGTNISLTDVADDKKQISVSNTPAFTTIRVAEGVATNGFDASGLGAQLTTISTGTGGFDETRAVINVGHGPNALGNGPSQYLKAMEIGFIQSSVPNKFYVGSDLYVGGDISHGSGAEPAYILVRNQIRINSSDSAGLGETIRLNGEDGSIVAEGDITAFGSVSDINLKENIEVIPNALDKVAQIRGVTFNYKDKPKEKMTGLIAQEVEQILPGVVYNVENDNKTNFKALRYGQVVGLLVEAIKELQTKVDELEKKCSCNNDQNS